MVSLSTTTSPLCDDQLRCLPYVCIMDWCKWLCIWITNRVCLSQCKCHSANYYNVMSLAPHKTWPLWKDGPSNNIGTNGLPTSWPLWNLFILIIVMAKHYNDVTMSAMASQITSRTIVYSTVHLGAEQRKHQRSASLAFVRGIHRWPCDQFFGCTLTLYVLNFS